MRQITKRLLPGQDLRDEIEKVVHDHDVKAGVLLSIVGCLTSLRLRVADGVTVKEWSEKFEIVSGTGTVSVNDSHIHIAAANQEGMTIGGHLKQGCIVGTTVELVVLAFDDIAYVREPDAATGYDELVIREKP